MVKYFHKQKVYIKMKKLIPRQKIEGKEKELKNYISQQRPNNHNIVFKNNTRDPFSN